MSNQLIEDGKVVEVNGQELECTAVSYQEADGQRSNFVYQFRLKSEVDAEREAEAAHQEQLELEAKAAEEGVDVAAPEPEQPKPIEEETQHVR